MTPMTTVDLARRAADVASAVAELDRPGLPALHAITTTPNRVWAYFPGVDAVQPLAQWAAAHDQPVTLDLSSHHSGRVSVRIPASFGELEIDESISTRRVYELGALLRIPVRDGDRVEVAGSALLIALVTEGAQ